MKPGDVIKHVKFMDIAAQIVAVNGLSVNVRWIYTGFKNSSFIDLAPQKITVEPGCWLEATDYPACLRYANWRLL